MTKGLEALELLTDSVYYALIECKDNISTENKQRYLNAYQTIEKGLKALEIILKEFRFTFDDEEQSVMIDNCYTVIFHNKEKYDLLKEVLLWVI